MYNANGNCLRDICILVNISSDNTRCFPVALLINFIPIVWKSDAVFLSRYMKGLPIFYKSIQNGYLFCQNGIQKGKGLDIAAESPCIELCRVPPAQAPVSLEIAFPFVTLLGVESKRRRRVE